MLTLTVVAPPAAPARSPPPIRARPARYVSAGPPAGRMASPAWIIASPVFGTDSVPTSKLGMDAIIPISDPRMAAPIGMAAKTPSGPVISVSENVSASTRAMVWEIIAPTWEMNWPAAPPIALPMEEKTLPIPSPMAMKTSDVARVASRNLSIATWDAEMPERSKVPAS